jgi:hypothetical protein
MVCQEIYNEASDLVRSDYTNLGISEKNPDWEKDAIQYVFILLFGVRINHN